ncbi:MAG TPA: DNA-processing protein DprA [Thermoanaerobaculia bacterium]|nr:DNA-processing protein DprA [Thermoanaerobaculia bacterium]
MSHSLRDLLIAWSLLPFLTPNRLRLLRDHFEPLTDVLRTSSTILQGLLNLDAAAAELVKNPLTSDVRRRVQSIQSSVVTLIDEDYPPLLKEIADPPIVLHVRGSRDVLKRDSVAVVGSRRATPYAINAARHLTAPLARDSGLCIVSGLARGIDAAAHRAALDQSAPTVAVLGTGIDIVYPRSHQRLAEAIIERGAVVTEFPPGTPPLGQNFPMRNRIISGLCLGVVIVEATSRSGSLITARMAAEQGREVFAVPGPIFSAGSEGTHRLIQYGAKLVHDANDVLDELPGYTRLPQAGKATPSGPLGQVLGVVPRDDAVHIDDAAARAGLEPAAIAQALLQLELDGWVEAIPGGRYVRIR